MLLTNLGVTPGSGIDLAVGTGDLTFACNGGVSCLTNPPSEGDVITPTVTVHNLGNQAANSAVVGYYVGDPNNGGRLLGNSYVATIAPGGTVTATLPWNTSGYTHTQTLYAFVDPPNAIAVTLENNNIVSQTLYIKTKPDLRVASIALSSTDRVIGEPITATLVISNTGETLASTNVTRINELGERGDSSTQDLPTGAIAPTSTVTVTTQLLPVQFGMRVITVTADATNVITESVESNNVLTRTVYGGIDARNIDSGIADDKPYSSTLGYGYLNSATYDFGGTITKTVRYDGNGAVQYRIDGLQPTRFYHLDATFYQEGDTFNQQVLFDGIDSGKVIPLVDSQASTTSILVPASAYTDTSLIVTFQRAAGASRPTRFRNPNSPVGPAFVSQLLLIPIEYTYLDAGGASDLAYDPTRGYGYLNGFTSTLGGTDAVSTYRTVFTNTLYYRFDNLNPSKNYFVDVTMYDGINSTRAQTVTVDGSAIASCSNLLINTIQRAQCAIPGSAYSTDGSIVVGIVCGNCTGPRLNEIALKEKTRDVISPSKPPTPTPTLTLTPTPTNTPTATPTNTVQTIVSAFAAQWSGSVVQIMWSTTKEYKTDAFQLYRSMTLNPGAWTVIKNQVSQSNCALQTTPAAYSFTDSNVVTGQTYYYRLAWTGDTCGAGTGGAYPFSVSTQMYLYLPLINRDGTSGLIPVLITPTPTSSPTPSRTPLPRQTPTRAP